MGPPPQLGQRSRSARPKRRAPRVTAGLIGGKVHQDADHTGSLEADSLPCGLLSLVDIPDVPLADWNEPVVLA
jgi:hypothetical protein